MRNFVKQAILITNNNNVQKPFIKKISNRILDSLPFPRMPGTDSSLLKDRLG